MYQELCSHILFVFYGLVLNDFTHMLSVTSLALGKCFIDDLVSVKQPSRTWANELHASTMYLIDKAFLLILASYT